MNATVGQDPRLLGQLAVALKNQIGQRPAAEIAGTDTLAAITARQRDAVGAVAEHVRLEMPRHAKVAAPGVGDLHIFQLREQFAEQIAAQLDFIAGQVEVMAQLAGELIPATGAEDQTIVGTALAVGDLAAEFTEGLAAIEADFVPGRSGQRFRGDN